MLLMVSPVASASLILNQPEEVLIRPDAPTPSPSFGPKFHFTRGEELIVYPRDEQPDSDAGVLSVLSLCLTLGVGLVFMISPCQRALVRLKLLD